MGVRGLQTFLEEYCPSACRTVNITELAKKYKNETGKDAVIVLDTQTFYWPWCKNLDWVIGYEIQEYLHRLRTFIDSFQKIGVKLVFFIGGVTVEKKRNRWLSRKTKNLKNTLELCDLLKKGSRTKYIPDEYESLPPSMGVITSMLLKHVLNCEVYMTIEECDEEILAYVHENECMAIFTQDTDFIVSDINKCKVLSSRKFNQNRMTTLLYDGEALASSLKIRTDQLPVFAIMAGNDYIDFETLKSVHRSLCGVRRGRRPGYNVLMPAIGQYINSLSNQSIDNVLETICLKIFGNTNRSALDLVKSSYNGYLLQKKCDDPELTNPSTKWSEILNAARDRHRNTIAPSYIWGILKDQFFELGVAFEDLRKPFSEQIPSAVVTRVFRQRMYGILMYEYEPLSDVKIEEWCAEHTLSYQQPVLVKPTIPTVEHPGLLRLWSDDKNKDELSEIKWKLFLWCISPNLISIDDWRLLTADLVAVSATLFYLIEQKFVDEDELNAVIATLATYSLYSREKLNSLDYGVHNPRCTHISICVIRTFTFVVTLMAAVGYPVPLSSDLVYLKFEAKLFQIKFKEMIEKKSVEELCENNEKSIEIFNQMKNVLGPAFGKSSVTESEGKGSENRADDGDKQSKDDDLAAKLAEMKVL
ncbi:constitutive coactivator of peroxisome proliferator-activated receptor gamma-like [Planococcus citri]|uniref:constitutive coactivator of peroxisome proliferator-activated receptor gamma-like n=1 Tax=Planococcus citri TaxID=170843 RepID=UPI0031FA1013